MNLIDSISKKKLFKEKSSLMNNKDINSKINHL